MSGRPGGTDDLGQRLQAIGVSLERFAELVPCHLNTLYLWRRGDHPAPASVAERLEELERSRLAELLARYPDGRCSA